MSFCHVPSSPSIHVPFSRANRLLTRPGILSTPKIATENRVPREEKKGDRDRERKERVVKAVEVEKRNGEG